MPTNFGELLCKSEKIGFDLSVVPSENRPAGTTRGGSAAGPVEERSSLADGCDSSVATTHLRAADDPTAGYRTIDARLLAHHCKTAIHAPQHAVAAQHGHGFIERRADGRAGERDSQRLREFADR